MPSTTLKEQLMDRLRYPGTGVNSIDGSETTIRRRQIIREKPFLNNIYREWYTRIARAVPPGPTPALEIGSGAGFLSEFVPDLITSDILSLPHVDRVVDACGTFPFPSSSLRAVALVDALHHLPDCQQFFREASRCIHSGGVVTMIEPWCTPWSSFVYSNFHHEPFKPNASEWKFESSGPLSSANGALPWILFSRDRSQFQRQFPHFEIKPIKPFMPIKYLLSGGVSMRSLSPSCSFGLWTAIEEALNPVMDHLAMFAHITLVKR